MANPKKFINTMADYDFSSLSEKQLKDVKKQITKVGGTFDYDTLTSKSKASAQIGDYVNNWVEAAESYQGMTKL